MRLSVGVKRDIVNVDLFGGREKTDKLESRKINEKIFYGQNKDNYFFS